MKRLISVTAVLALVVLVCSCSNVTVGANDDVLLTFICGEKNISVTLEADEAENREEPLFRHIIREMMFWSFRQNRIMRNFTRGKYFSVKHRSFLLFAISSQ